MITGNIVICNKCSIYLRRASKSQRFLVEMLILATIAFLAFLFMTPDVRVVAFSSRVRFSPKTLTTYTLGPTLDYVRHLDNARLGRQRIEAKQLIEALEKLPEKHRMFITKGNSTTFKSMKMWNGHTTALKVYCNKVFNILSERGFLVNESLYEVDESKCPIIQCQFDGKRASFAGKADENTFPIWYSFPPFYYAQRATLIAKDPDFYEEKFISLNSQVRPYLLTGFLWPGDHGKELYEKWDFDYLSPSSAGVALERRISRDLVDEWLKNKNRNPRTGRLIRVGYQVYTEFEKAAQAYGLINVGE